MEGPLLYDLHEIKEWDPVEEEVNVPKTAFSLLSFVPGLGSYNKERHCNGLILPTWEVKISPDETRFAIMTNAFVEVYSVPDTLLGRSKCFDDSMSRQIVWSGDSDYLLIPTANGKKFYLFDGFSAHFVYCIFSPSWNGANSLAFTEFLGTPPHSTWTDHLLAISDKGKAVSFLIGKTGFQECSNFSFGPKIVSSAIYTKKYNLLVIAHWDSSHGLYVLGVWRPVNEEPYFQKVETYLEGMDVHPILRMSLSHCESKILILDSEGTLKIYQIPTLSLLFISLIEDQPLYDEVNPSLLQDPKLISRKNDFLNSSIKWHPYKVEWWDKDAVIVSRFSGSVSIITIEAGKESRNLLGDSVEFFSDIPSITPRFGKYILCLERDYEEAEEIPENEVQSKRWSWGFSEKHNHKRIISNYRLIAMVKMTPEELYQRKIDKEEYGEALVLAEVFGLDSDLVYLRRWHLSNYSIHAQNDFLHKIRDTRTVTKECLEIVPTNIHDAKELLQFGLKTVQSEETHDSVLESKFQRYISLLKTYERLIRSFGKTEIKFNANFFFKFRDTSIENSIEKFAQLGYWDSIRVMFEMHFEEISRNYIQLLSNFPESYSPLEYSFILPFADHKSKDVIYPFGDGGAYKEYKLSFEALQNWYKNRSLAIEEATGLPDNSIDLLEFAKRHGVKVDEEFLLDLTTLKTLIYDLGKTRLNYTLFKKMSNAQKVEEFVLTLSSNEEVVLISSRIQEYLIPFLESQDKMREGSYNAILKEYFSRSRPRDISFDKEIIFNLPERKVREPEFISLCMDSLFRLNDDYQTLCEILLLFMEHSRMTILQEVCTIMNINVITQKYGYSKSMNIDSQDYKNVKFIDTVIEDLCKNGNFLQHIESPELAAKALDDIFTICKSNSRIDLNTYFKSTLSQLLRSENTKILVLLVECLTCAQGRNCDCFYHKCIANYDLNDLTPDQKESILLSTAEYYLDASHFIGDHNVSLAELCLKKISPDIKEVKRMRNILQVGYLLHDFSIQISPSQLKDTENAGNIIADILIKNKKNYKKHAEILKIASLLSSQEAFIREAEEIIAKYALEEAEDVRSALCLVKKMISHSYEPAAGLCFKILQMAPHLSIEDRMALSQFCFQFGEPSQVLALLDDIKRKEDELMTVPSSSQGDNKVVLESPLEFNFHPFYDTRPRLYEQTSLWTLPYKYIDKNNAHAWVSQLMNYDVLGAISLMTALHEDKCIYEDKDEKNHLFIKAYVASIVAFSPVLRADTILISPKTLISAAVEESHSVENHPIKSVMSRFNNYIEARRLYDIDANIDVVRFVNDETYKFDTILGLSMSSDVHSFNLAMKYAQDNESIDAWELCLNFLRSVFDDDPANVNQILEHNPKVTKILSENPSKLETCLKKYIYQSLNGKDYDMMLMYFRLLQTLELIPESELKLMKKLIMKSKALNTSSVCIDLKEVLGDSSSLNASLRSIIDSSSLSKVISLTEVLSQINPEANTGLIYQSLCEKYFESGMNKGLSIEQIFEQCEEYLKKMSGAQLKEFVVSVSFKSQTISLAFNDREIFLLHLKDLAEEPLVALIESWIQFNSDLSSLPSPSTDLLFDLKGTLGDKNAIKSMVIQRIVEGKSTFNDLIPVIDDFLAVSKEGIFKEALMVFLDSNSEETKVLKSLLSAYDEHIVNEEEMKNINASLIDWCMKSQEKESLIVKDIIIEFVRKKSEDQDSLLLVSLHKSRLILAEKFNDVEVLLPNLNNKTQFIQKLMDEVMNCDNVSAVLDLVCFWGEGEEEKYIEDKRRILEFIIEKKIAFAFRKDLDKFSLDQLPGIESILEICYKNKEVRFAFDLLKYCSSFNEDMNKAVRVLEAAYPLTWGKDPHAPKSSSDFIIPFSLWIEERVEPL